jgi:hypothetical protein
LRSGDANASATVRIPLCQAETDSRIGTGANGIWTGMGECLVKVCDPIDNPAVWYCFGVIADDMHYHRDPYLRTDPAAPKKEQTHEGRGLQVLESSTVHQQVFQEGKQNTEYP